MGAERRGQRRNALQLLCARAFAGVGHVDVNEYVANLGDAVVMVNVWTAAYNGHYLRSRRQRRWHRADSATAFSEGEVRLFDCGLRRVLHLHRHAWPQSVETP